MFWTILAIVFGIWILGFLGLLIFASGEGVTSKEKLFIATIWPYIVWLLIKR